MEDAVRGLAGTLKPMKPIFLVLVPEPRFAYCPPSQKVCMLSSGAPNEYLRDHNCVGIKRVKMLCMRCVSSQDTLMPGSRLTCNDFSEPSYVRNFKCAQPSGLVPANGLSVAKLCSFFVVRLLSAAAS